MFYMTLTGSIHAAHFFSWGVPLRRKTYDRALQTNEKRRGVAINTLIDLSKLLPQGQSSTG